MRYRPLGRVKEFTPLRPAMEPWGDQIAPAAFSAAMSASP